MTAANTNAERAIWDAILYPQGIPNPNIITIQFMPPDSSCFYHALYNGLCNLPDTCGASNAITTLFETHRARLVTFIEGIDRDTTELDLPSSEQINYTHVIRFIIAINAGDADFEKYQMLCIAEPENHIYADVRGWRTGMLLTLNDDYANMITIDIIRRVLRDQAGLDLGIYIYCVPDQFNTGGLTSDREWHNKPYNIFLELVSNIHYNLIGFNALIEKKGRGIVLTPKQLQRVYWSRAASPPPNPALWNIITIRNLPPPTAVPALPEYDIDEYEYDDNAMQL